MKKRFGLVIIISILVIGMISSCIQLKKESPEIDSGVLNLTHWDIKTKGLITLSGDWNFYWKHFYNWQDLNNINTEPILAHVPNVWNDYNHNSLPGDGYATYHLKVKVKDEKVPLSLRISSMSTAYQCYINDTLIAENGKISKSAQGGIPYYKPLIATFAPPSKEFDIIIYVSNYTYARGGIWYEINMGTVEQINQLDTILKYKDGIVIGSLSIMALSYFIFTFVLRGNRKNINFILMCIILIIRTTLYGDYLIMKMFPNIPFGLLVWITYLTIYWFPVILYNMIEATIGREEKKNIKILFLLYACFMTIITAILPVRIYTEWIFFIEAMGIIISLYAIFSIFKAYLKKVDGASTILLGSSIIVLAGIHDVLYQANKINNPLGELASISLVFFMFLLAFLMAKRFTTIFNNVEILSQQLSERLKSEQELTAKLYALDKLKDEFLANTSHELRTPLNGMINITQSLLKGIGGELTTIQEQNLEVVLSSSKKLHTLINDLLDVTLLKHEGIQVYPTPIDFSALIHNMFVVFEHLKQSDKVVLMNEVPSDCPLILADEGRLRQIINNLMGNALKFTSEGTVRIKISNDEKWLFITIEDTGIGIAPEHLERVFHAFEQIDGTIQRKYEGTGLGLYITKQLVELHGGKIWINSQPKRGTTVYFTMPITELKPETKSEEIILEKMKEDDTLYGSGEDSFDILVVEDDLANRKALTNILQLNGYRVKGVNHGRTALEVVENGIQIKLIILDVMMPEISGYEVLELLRQKYNMIELPILMLTAKAHINDISLGFKLGANDYLAKPFEADELLARVRSLVKLKNAVNQLVNSEMSFLQAQIKPHFIHNALSVISSLSIKDPKKSKELILDLSDYLRGCFDFTNKDGLTTLTRELELVQAYLSIEQARFKERLAVRFHLLKEIECTLPLLTIQPLVENAIRHGIMCKLQGGHIDITISKEGKRIRIEVKDNGVGIDSDLIRQFFAIKQDRRGVGIVNIHRRLMTLYGEGLHINSVLNEGTTIFFYVPYYADKEILNECVNC